MKTIIYCWIPSHIGIYGNEKVDKNAKESLNLRETVFKIPYVNFKLFIYEFISDKWQTIWNGARFDKLREVEPIVKRPRVIHKLSRREEIVLACNISDRYAWHYNGNMDLAVPTLIIIKEIKHLLNHLTEFWYTTYCSRTYMYYHLFHFTKT